MGVSEFHKSTIGDCNTHHDGNAVRETDHFTEPWDSAFALDLFDLGFKQSSWGLSEDFPVACGDFFFGESYNHHV